MDTCTSLKFYTGKSDTGIEEGLASNIVQQLTAVLHGTFSHETFDNFFSSPAFMETLYTRHIYATATVRTNPKGLPLIAQNKDMKKGQSNWRVKDHVGFVQW
ncbi:unnamed protein product [Calicophoron daubneyi]|uniref:PiggyBac transposable element-derived protein domain-containing protein n=1 Tax=Calicophoron daubneyi TaxID=300641 RepID=A0AAV2T6W2_CALDB